MPSIKPLTKEEVLDKINKGESFEGVEIGDVDFSESSFDKPVNFEGAVFKGKADFTSATFKNVSSWKAKFEGKTDFSFAKFEGITYFLEAKFEGITSFSNSTFRKTVHFENTKFNGITSFYNTVFEDRAYFKGIREFNNTCFYNITYWNYVRFLKPKLIDFTSVDFSKCKLSYADFSSVNLVDIRWAKKKKRRVIFDETEYEKKINYPIVENAYRRLKKNYENSGDYPYAGDFHSGEMEMKRLAQKKFFRWFSLTTLYKIFSGYGEKIWRSVLWLFLFFLFFTFSYLFTGLQSGSLLSESGKHETIEYNFVFDFRSDSVSEFFGDFYTSLSHSFEVIFLKREKLFETFTNTGRIFEVLQVLSIMIFITLSIMALKRKFRR